MAHHKIDLFTSDYRYCSTACVECRACDCWCESICQVCCTHRGAKPLEIPDLRYNNRQETPERFEIQAKAQSLERRIRRSVHEAEKRKAVSREFRPTAIY